MAASAVQLGKSTRSLPFTKRLAFQKTLNERIKAYLRENKTTGRDLPEMYVKTAVVLAWWLAAYLLLLLGGFSTPVNLLLCVVWGMAIASVGFNVMHDANHGAYSDNPRINKLMGLTAEMLGISGFRWRTKHNVWHHTYTNIAGYDDDIETFGTLRLTPRLPWKPLYRIQAWYFPVIYSFIALDFFLRDFMMAFTGKTDDNHIYPKMSTEDKVTFWVGKVFFVLIMFVLPMLVFPWWQVLAGFFITMFIVGLLLGVVFQLAHINGEALFPEPVGNPPHVENEWAVHQVQTTADFAPKNWLLNFYIGGLNYQVEHHLLPHICHIMYPRLAPIVKQTCDEFGIRYNLFPTWRQAFGCHLRILSTLGRKEAA